MTQHMPTAIQEVLLRLDATQGGEKLSHGVKELFVNIFMGKNVARDNVNALVQESEKLLQNTMSPDRIARFRRSIYGAFDRHCLTSHSS